MNLYGIIGTAITMALYLLPTLIVNYTNHRYRNAVYFMNIFLGWTIIFWVVSMIVALLPKSK